MDELRQSSQSFGRICLSQYHEPGGKNVDIWSVREFLALPLLPTKIEHYIQMNINTKSTDLTNTNGLLHPK